MKGYTLIVPYYRNPLMLREQLARWRDYPPEVRIILVDDGSPEPAYDVLREQKPAVRRRVELVCIEVDIPWNRGGARNLGAKLAETPWIMHIDIDHILMPDAARSILLWDPSPKHWYRFCRYRVGAADETRNKDKLAREVTFGEIKPHIDSYLCTKRMFWDAGGYDEDYSGCLGGGSPFLAQLEQVAGKPILAPESMYLHVYTRHAIADSSDMSLSRDTSEYSRRRKEKEKDGAKPGINPLRFPWHREETMYPNVVGEVETVQQLLKGQSIARFGDGELKILGGGEYRRQPEPNKKLTEEMRAVVREPPPGCLLGIPTMDPHGPKFNNWRRHRARFVQYFRCDDGRKYYSSLITRPDSAPWLETQEYFDLLRALWIGRGRIALVSESTSKILTVTRMTNEVLHIECPTYRAYDHIDDFERRVLASGVELALLSCGVAATCLAPRLARAGLQAIDIGSVGGFLARWATGAEVREPDEVETA